MIMQNKLAQLFSFISQNPKHSLTKVFSLFAKKWSLSRDSVRNIYYQNYSKVIEDAHFCEKFSIIPQNFKKNNPKTFTEEEKNWLLNEVNCRLKNGYSLRKSCLELACGDANLMVRYLNKYRALSKNCGINQTCELNNNAEINLSGNATQKGVVNQNCGTNQNTQLEQNFEFNQNSEINKNSAKFVNTKIAPPKKERTSVFVPKIEKEKIEPTLPTIEASDKNAKNNIINDIKNQYEPTKNEEKIIKNQNKIIKMPEKDDVLTEKDIQSLFIGLIRLVKNNTIKEMNFALNEKYKEKITEIYALKHNLGIIKNQLEEEKRISNKLQIELNLLKNSKLEEYGEFMNKLNSNEYGTKNKLN